MNYILFDDNRTHLLPLTYTRPVSEIRIGILTITEKWQKVLSSSVSFLTEEYLNLKYPLKALTDNVWVNGSICPNQHLVNAIRGLQNNQCLKKDQTIIAYRSKDQHPPAMSLNIPNRFYKSNACMTFFL